MERFWSKVDKSGDCWGWTASKNRQGYGRFSLEGVQQAAHRVAYLLERSEIPEKFCVCHSCDNPSCVNPDHLFLGTKADNNIDKAEKGRSTIGETNPMAKLTEEEVRWIRQLGGPMRKIAKCFGIGIKQVSRIKARESWAHVK